MKIGFIGLGNMAGAMIGGMIRNRVAQPGEIVGADASPEAAGAMREKFAVKIAADNREAALADLLILSVKPQYYQSVIEEIRDASREDQIILAIAPGKTLHWLESQFGRELKFARCMPNTPALVGEGCTGVCFGGRITSGDRHKVMEILESFGRATEVPEAMMDAVAGVSGSSPAYVFLFIEALADAGVAGGLPRKQAYEFAAQAVLGSAKMVLETGRHPGELKDMVCSPAGTTIEAVRVLEERGFRSAVMEAARACMEKSKKI